VFEKFTDRARRVVVLAQEEARMLNHNYIGTEHILLGLIREGEGLAAKALESLGISLEAVREKIEEIVGLGLLTPEGHLALTPRATKVLELSLREASQLGLNYIGTEHILLGLIREGEGVAAQVLAKRGADLDAVRQQIIQLQQRSEPPQPGGVTAVLAPSILPASELLDRYGRNLTQAAREGRLYPIIGREKETERVMQVISRRTKNTPVLVGEPGVGRSAVVERLAQAIVVGEVPAMLRDRTVYALDPGALQDEARGGGDASERWKAIVREITTRGDVILFIEEIHDLVAVLPAFRAALIAGTLQVIGATTPEKYQQLEQDFALNQQLQQIPVAGLSVAHTVEILKGQRDWYEAHHGALISDSTLVLAATLADRYLPNRPLLGKALDLIDEAGARMRTRQLVPPPDLREFDEQITVIRRDKESAIDAQDFDTARALRDQEKALMAAKARREQEWKESQSLDALIEITDAEIEEAFEFIVGESMAAALTMGGGWRRGGGGQPVVDFGDEDPGEVWTLA